MPHLAYLESLIRELDEVCALAQNSAEASLSEASLAVARATISLNRLAAVRGHSLRYTSDAARAIQEAREAVATARAVVLRSREATRQAAERSAAEKAEVVAAAVEAICAGCGRPFRLSYRSGSPAPIVAFPVACPAIACEAATSVEYPADAMDVEVGPAAM